MNKLVIVTSSFYDFEKKAIKIGGVETYIMDLALLGIKSGAEVFVYLLESSRTCFQTDEYEGIKIIALPFAKKLFKSGNQVLFDRIFSEQNGPQTKFVIATDQMDIKCKADNVIAIQHGIAFDIPGYLIGGLWGKTKTLQLVNKLLRCLRNVQRFYRTRNTVCVDYNYYSWFRTIGTIYPEFSMNVIPNYASDIISKEEFEKKQAKQQQMKKVLFARRFVDYRGALLFAEVVDRILTEREDVEFTFAGNGPLESTLKSKFKGNKRVNFTSFTAKDSVQFHKQYDIAVVPTIFSEGTSLSLCEAMASGCYPIATHVGGMTNMILDGFNGSLVYPSFEGVYNALVGALSMTKKSFDNIVINSYNTALYAFNKESWEKKWLKVLMTE